MSILRNSLISAAILFAMPAFAQSANSANPGTVAQGANVAGSQKVTFNNGGVRILVTTPERYRRQSAGGGSAAVHLARWTWTEIGPGRSKIETSPVTVPRMTIPG